MKGLRFNKKMSGFGGNLIFISLFILPLSIFAQEEGESKHNPDSLITAAGEIIAAAKYCALITLDQSGHPQARTMDPFPPEEDMVIWLGTNSNSRKVREIQKDSRVSIYYEAPSGEGYVVLKGHAFLINDKSEKSKRWKEEWDAYYADRKVGYILIKVVPDELEIVSYRHNIVSNSKTWAAPALKLKSLKSDE